MIKRITAAILIVGLATLLSCSKADPFTELLARVEGAPAGQKESVVKAFLQRQKQIPLINDTTVIFILHNSAQKQPFLTGDMANWRKDSLPMQRIKGTDYWYRTVHFPADARIEYKFVAGGKFLPDSLNELTSEGGFGANSVLLMPDYTFPQEILFKREHAVSALDTLTFVSKKRHNRRAVFVYRHPKATAHSPLLLFHDGADYLKFAKAQIILDNLIADSAIPAVNAVFVNPRNRTKEYWLNEAFLDMTFNELLPFIRQKYGWRKAAPLYMGGASLGGEISLLALKNYQRRLAGVFSQSGALWIEKNTILKIIAALPGIQPKLYFDYGTFENQRSTHARLQKILTEKKAHYKINRWHDGHNWGNWRGHLKHALKYLLTREGRK